MQQQKFHVLSGITNKMKSFITILLYSYNKKANTSTDISLLKRYFITKRPNSSITFYLKLRKTIITNFSYQSRTQMLDGQSLKFDDWSTITTRFLGAESISQIGTKVKEVNSKTRVYDKILTNSIDAVVFVQTCIELFESKLQGGKAQEKNFKESRSISQHSQQEQNSQELSQNKIEENGSDQNNSVIEQADEIQFPIQIALDPTKQNQQKPEIFDSQKVLTQQKLINSLQETKYSLLDTTVKQGQSIGRAVKVYEILADEYSSLAKQSKKQNQFINYLLNKLKASGVSISEQDKKAIEDLNAYKYLQHDLKEQLKATGAYNYAQ